MATSKGAQPIWCLVCGASQNGHIAFFFPASQLPWQFRFSRFCPVVQGSFIYFLRLRTCRYSIICRSRACRDSAPMGPPCCFSGKAPPRMWNSWHVSCRHGTSLGAGEHKTNHGILRPSNFGVKLSKRNQLSGMYHTGVNLLSNFGLQNVW